MAAMKRRDFAVVASSIRSMRIVVQTDLDRSYSVHGALVLDRLTEQLADNFAARYPGFNRAAFLSDTRVHQAFGGPADDVSTGPCIGSDPVYTVGCNMPGGSPEHYPCSFKCFEEAKSAMTQELDHLACTHAQQAVKLPDSLTWHLADALRPETLCGLAVECGARRRPCADTPEGDRCFVCLAQLSVNV
jgi:hypothetical protein